MTLEPNNFSLIWSNFSFPINKWNLCTIFLLICNVSYNFKSKLFITINLFVFLCFIVNLHLKLWEWRWKMIVIVKVIWNFIKFEEKSVVPFYSKTLSFISEVQCPIGIAQKIHCHWLHNQRISALIDCDTCSYTI